MKFKFLVLLAVLCLSVHLSYAHKEAEKPKAEKPAKAEKKAHAKAEVVEIEEVQVIHHKKEPKQQAHKDKKTHIEVKNVVKKKEGKKQACADLVKKDKENCETKNVPAGHKAIFSFKDDAVCSWTCDYEALPGVAPVEHHKKLVKKLKEKKAPKPLKKECSGVKRIQFSNCLVNIKGLIAWGDNTKNFDKKFEKLLQKKAKKAKKAK